MSYYHWWLSCLGVYSIDWMNHLLNWCWVYNYCTWIGYFDQIICRMGEGNHWMSYFGQGIYKVRENNQNLTGWY